jgi:hypothetical protein
MIDHEKPLHIQTSTGKPIYTGYSDGPKDSPYTDKEHIEVSAVHESERNLRAIEASNQEAKGNIHLAKHYKALAGHHAKVSQLHGRKSGISKAPTPAPKKPAMSAGMAQKLKGKPNV